jgi:hypothetical protein
MEYIANSSVSYEDVEYDAVLIHSRSQGDKVISALFYIYID